MRLHPSVPILSRICTEAYVLSEQSGVKPTIEVGTTIMIPMHSIHRDPEYYSLPEEFIPERFDEEFGGVKAFRDKGILFPFGDGPRICLGLFKVFYVTFYNNYINFLFKNNKTGIKFALAQTKAAIAEIIDKFELTKSTKTQLPLVMEPKHFLNVKLGGLWVDFKNI